VNRGWRRSSQACWEARQHVSRLELHQLRCRVMAARIRFCAHPPEPDPIRCGSHNLCSPNGWSLTVS